MIDGLVLEIAKAIKSQGGRAFFVGGKTRNDLMRQMGYLVEKNDKDIDIEVYFLPKDILAKILSQFGEVNFVGKAFGVFKLNNNIDIALPRKEIQGKINHNEKTIILPRTLNDVDLIQIKERYPDYQIKICPHVPFGHKDFIIISDPFLSYREACKRRDFTINSILVDIITKEIIDPYNGIQDIKKGVIRATNPKAFIEDALRVYRAVQFAARFGFTIDDDTKELCRQVDLSCLPKERVYAELEKLLLLSKKPSIGFNYMKELGVLRYHPLLQALVDCPQDPTHHPEGSVWNHTMMVIDEAAKRKDQSKNPTAFMWAALLHDIGKPATTEVRDGKITAYNHDKKGKDLAIAYMKTLTDDKKLISEVAALVEHHMKPMFYQKSKDTIKDGAFLKLATKVNLKDLILLSTCDRLGRLGVDVEQEEREMLWFKNRCERLNILEDKPHPIITGKLLLTLGYKPCPRMGKIIKEAYQMQLKNNWGQEQLVNFVLKQYPPN